MKARSYQPLKVHPGSYPLSGLLKCPECGSPMLQGNSSKKYKYYQCSKNKNSGKVACSSNLIKKEYAEETVFKSFTMYINSLDLSASVDGAIAATLSFELEPLEREMDNLKKEIKQIKVKMDNVIELMYDTELSLDKEFLKGKLKKQQDQLNRKNSNLIEITQYIKFKQNQTSNEIINFCSNNFNDFSSLLLNEEKKLLLNHIIKEIHVTNGATTNDRKIKNIVYYFNNNDLAKL
ncbi:zinc ribbon domain-containing protein [Bacillus sp. 2205SS5-2]|uniref:zinc ribbon domain-containing protein n=1 Tax=Bacillus sp. 2205SS5-2 TaxID=3109031 RepID=UPI0030066E71